jgi:hypothetical protein
LDVDLENRRRDHLDLVVGEVHLSKVEQVGEHGFGFVAGTLALEGQSELIEHPPKLVVGQVKNHQALWELVELVYVELYYYSCDCG